MLIDPIDLCGTMTSLPAAFEIRRDEGTSVWWSRGSIITVKLGRDDAGGAVTLAEQMCPPGYATPLHIHHEHDEVLLAREGHFDIYYGREADDLEVCRTEPGDAVFLEKGAPHGFHNTSDEPRGLYILFESPLEMGFLEAGHPVDVPAGTLPEAPPEIRESEQLGTLDDAYATEVLGPVPAEE